MAENETVPQEPTEQEPQGTEPTDYEALYKESVKESRKWESRAKANKEKADKWDEYEQQGMSDAEKLTKRAEDEKARRAEIDDLREKVNTDEYIERIAKEKLGLVKSNANIFKDISENE